MSAQRYSQTYTFEKAQPVWIKGEENEMNVTAVFAAAVTDKDVKIRLSGASSFILLVNGEFVAYGPSRRAHGFYDVDEYDLSQYMTGETNLIAVRLAGYHVNSFSHLDVMPFLCAEILCGGKVTVWTAPQGGFTVTKTTDRVTRVPRFSFQRPFTEAYRLVPGAFAAETTLQQKSNVTLFDLQAREGAAAMTFLRRSVPYGNYEIIKPEKMLHRGALHTSPKDKYYSVRNVTEIGYKQKGFTERELELPIHVEYGKLDFLTQEDASNESADVIALSHNSYADLAFDRDWCGIFEFDVEGNGGKLYVAGCENVKDGNIDPLRIHTISVIECIVQPGKYHVICAEPYVQKYVRLAVLGGPLTVSNLQLRKVSFPVSTIPVDYRGNDADLRLIYDAARETFAANASDIFMDCPGRERAGWLCDSFFTSRVEYALTEKSAVETSFLENFLLPKSFDNIPAGMLPMCYPADHYDHCFIPNWAMWFVLELEEYITKRHGEKVIAEMAKQRLYDLLGYFRKYENKEGLLEKLDSWVFVEWSKCNQLTQDVNYPTNMVYAAVKDAIANLYGDAALHAEAQAMRDVIRTQAMTPSGFFCDNAVYDKNGVLQLTNERTETCQYYAFWFGIATPETHPQLWHTMLHDFGYDRQKTGKFPEIYPANAFIGNYLRLDLLDRYSEHDMLLDNIRGYFTYMAKSTGTLWENVDDGASVCHGFASHVVVWMKDMGLVK